MRCHKSLPNLGNDLNIIGYAMISTHITTHTSRQSSYIFKVVSREDTFKFGYSSFDILHNLPISVTLLKIIKDGTQTLFKFTNCVFH